MRRNVLTDRAGRRFLIATVSIFVGCTVIGLLLVAPHSIVVGPVSRGVRRTTTAARALNPYQWVRGFLTTTNSGQNPARSIASHGSPPFSATTIEWGATLLLDARGYLINLLAGVACSAIVILVGLLAIDSFVDHLREMQWAKVRNLTCAAIAAHLCELGVNASIYYTIGDGRIMANLCEGRDTPSPSTLTGFQNLLEQLRGLPDSMSREKSTSDVAVEYYEAVRWDLAQIQNVLLPRVMQSSTDQALIDALVEFDGAHRELYHAIIGHKAVVQPFRWAGLAAS